MEKKKLTLILRVIMIPVAIISIVIFPPWNGIWAWVKPLPDSVQQQVNDAVGHGLDGIIVYVDKAGQAPAFYAAGWHDRKTKIPAYPKALFKIASISKLYVAASIAKLVDRQQLSLDKTLADYFPELLGRIENADKITLKMMVQHRSGIPNYTDSPDFHWNDPPKTSADNLALALDLPSLFAPDTDYEYSNTNYLLLRELIGKVVGYRHFQFIKEEILNPLKLNNTFGSLSEVDSKDVMSGYYGSYDYDFKDIDFGMLATVEDVGIFLRALNNGSLFSESEQAIYSSIYEYEHKGWVLGYQSIARYHPDLDTVVIQFVNTVSEETELTALVVYNRIVEILQQDNQNDE